MSQWFEALGLFEMLTSLSTFHFNHQDFAFPTFGRQPQIQARNLGHPLIQEENRVSNQVDFGPNPNVMIVTGSNMSGKSTFLRTLGVNTVLAQMGAPVCAESYHSYVTILHTSLRVADSLQENTSYFYAELKKLKSILDDLEDDKPALILLDEVLKGTNSEDKLFGAQALVRRLKEFPSLVFLATHILSLSDLADEFPASIANFCFESKVVNGDQLVFDYRLKSGPAQQKNATFLMKKMGLID